MNGKLCTLAIVAAICVLQSSASSMYRPVIDYEEDYDLQNVDLEDLSDTLLMNIDNSKTPGLKICQPGFCCPGHLECRSLFCFDPISKIKMHSVLNC